MATMNPKPLDSGVLELYTLAWPPDTAGADDAVVSMAMVVFRRPGGLLLALPLDSILQEDLQMASGSEGDSLLGPHRVFIVPSFRDDMQELPDSEQDIDVLVVDVSAAILPALARYSEMDGATLCFSDDPAVLPSPDPLLKMVRQWLLVQASAQVAFYSADEDLVPETPRRGRGEGGAYGGRQDTIKEKSDPKEAKGYYGFAGGAADSGDRDSSFNCYPVGFSSPRTAGTQGSDGISRVSGAPKAESTAGLNIPGKLCEDGWITSSSQGFSNSVFSAPTSKAVPPLVPSMDGPLTLQEQAGERPAPGGSTLAMAVLEQSKALTTLVSQLQAGGDPLLDAQTSASGFSLGSKGAAGREKLQTELLNRSGNFYLAVTQNAWRRLKPATRMPPDINSVASTDFSMVSYLEKFGGYGGSPEMGLVQFCLAHIYDAALHSDWEGVKEHFALTMTAVEQSVQDNNRWDLAYQLTLLEEPASQLWSYRQTTMNPRVRAFASLCPQRWATVALAYLKEVDYIQSRRTDLARGSTAPNPVPPNAPSPAPKKKWKGPKAKASPEPAAE